MKNRILILTGILLTVLSLTMCSKHGSKDFNDDEAMKLEVVVLLGCDTVQSPVARQIINFLDFSLIEIYDPDNQDVLTYHYMDSFTGESLLLMASEDNIIITEYDPITGRKGDEALVSSAAAGFDRLVLSKVDWKTGSFETIASIDLPESSKAVTKADDFENEVRELLVKHLDEFSSKVSDLGSSISFLGPISEGAGMVCDLYTNLAIPKIKSFLYYDDPKKQEEIANETLKSLLTGFITDRIKIKGLTGSQYLFIGKKSYKVSGYLTETILKHIPDFGSDEHNTEYYLSYASSSVSSSMKALTSTQYSQKKPFTLTVAVSNISETSAKLSGTYKLNSSSGGHYASMGFSYSGGGTSETIVTSDQLKSVSINGLEEATTYYAMSYIQTIFETYYSTPVAFTTKGIRFETSESSISFDKKGGTAQVGITIGDESVWEVSSSPDWCSTSANGNTLTITAKKSTKERKGQIVLSCTNMYGESQTRTISVSQNSVSWNGTSWLFSGNLEYSSSFAGENLSGNAPLEYMLVEIYDCENGDVSIDYGDSENYHNEVSVDKDGNLILKQTLNGMNSGVNMNGEIKYILSRTGTDTATGTFSGKITVDLQQGLGNMTFKFNGTLNGRRIEQ